MLDLNIELVLSGKGTTASGMTLNNGTAVCVITPKLTAGETGEIPVFDFSDIIAGAWTKIGEN